MAQALALYNGASETDVELMIVMEMREGFAAIEEAGEPIVPPRHGTMLNA